MTNNQKKRGFFKFLFQKEIDKQVQDILQENNGHNGFAYTQESNMIHNILSITDKTAEDVMIPRADIIGIDVNENVEDIIKLVLEEPHSRYPVYKDNPDDVIGVVHIKDILALEVGKKDSSHLKEYIKKVSFIAPTMRVLDLLLTMRVSGNHMAIVVDEYGGVDGQVTIADIIEEIVGEIRDEFDEEEEHIIEKGNHSYILDGRMPLDELTEKLSDLFSAEVLKTVEEDIDTVGGLATSLAKRLPIRGEIIIFPEANVEFEIVTADPRRVKKILVRPISKSSK